MSEGHFEAVKYAYRQSKDGFVLSFVVHPNDMPDALATAPIGTAFMIGFASIEPAGGTDPKHSAQGQPQDVRADGAPPAVAKPNSTRAVMMAKDSDVWNFFDHTGLGKITDPISAEMLIKQICGVKSKSELNEGRGAAEFERLRQDFYAWRRAA